LRGSEIDGDAALVPVEELMVNARPVDDRRHGPRRVAAARILQLDDVGAEVREGERRVRSRQQPREIEDADAVKRQNIIHCSRGLSRLCVKPYVKYRTRPSTSQTAKRSHAVCGRPSMMYTQPSADRTDTGQTYGTLNGRGRSGSL